MTWPRRPPGAKTPVDAGLFAKRPEALGVSQDLLETVLVKLDTDNADVAPDADDLARAELQQGRNGEVRAAGVAGGRWRGDGGVGPPHNDRKRRRARKPGVGAAPAYSSQTGHGTSPVLRARVFASILRTPSITWDGAPSSITTSNSSSRQMVSSLQK